MDKFSEIYLKAKSIVEKSQQGYKLYKDKENFVFIEALTAKEAIEKSGINPVRIERAGLANKSIFSESELVENG
jgi:uncharacterized protein YjhX (UPF0386 family)